MPYAEADKAFERVGADIADRDITIVVQAALSPRPSVQRLRNLFAGAVASALLAAAPAAAQQPAAVPYTDVRAVGSRADVHKVVQDTRGFLWTASSEGLCRYDGFEWMCPLATTAVAAAPDPAGGVWTLLASGTLVRFDGAPRTVAKLVAPRRAATLAADGRGGLWVGTSVGLIHVTSPDKGSAATQTILTTPTSALVAAPSGRTFVATGNHVLELADPQPRSIWQAPLPVDALAVAPDGGVVVALQDGQLWHVSGSDLPPRQRNVTFKGANRIRTMTFDTSRRLWVGIRDQLYVVDAEDRQRKHVDLSYALATYQFNTLLVDHEGSLWAGTPIGLLQLRFNHPVRMLGSARGRGGNPFTFSVTATETDDVWSAHPRGLALWRDDRITLFEHGSQLPFEGGRSLASDETGTLWVADMYKGLFRRAGDAFVPVPGPGGPTGVQSVRPRRGGGVWVGLASGGLATATGDRIEVLAPPRGDHTDHAMDMIESTIGTLWVASSGRGLTRHIGDEVVAFGAAEGVPDDIELLCLARGAERGLWIGTDGAGLIRFDGTRGRAVTTEHGLDHDSVYGLVADSRGRLWMSSPRGVSMLQQADVEAVVRGQKSTFNSLLFGPQDGLSGEPIRAFPPTLSVTRDGRVLVPTGLGVLEIDPQRIRALPPPRLYVEELFVDGQRHVASDDVTAEVRRRANVVIKVSAPTFIEPHRVRIEYRREADEAWTTVSGRRVALEDVAIGKHRWLMRTAVLGERTTFGEPVAVQLRLQPYWHARTSVRLGMLAFALSLLYAIHRLRMGRLANTHAAVLADRSRIAHEIHDGLEQNLSGLRLQIEAAALSAERAPAKTRAHVERAGAILDEAMLDLRTAIWGLQSSTTTTQTLFNQLSQRFKTATAETGLTFESTCVGPSRNLPMAVATHLANIAREAVGNATKHGKATRISLALDTSAEREVILEVSDNGVGVEAEGSEPTVMGTGLGLAGMKERARTIKGRIHIGRGPDGGTQVKVWAPI